MKRLLFLLALILLISCSNDEPKVKQNTLIFEDYTYDVYKITIDSVDYLVAKSINGISIIKK